MNNITKLLKTGKTVFRKKDIENILNFDSTSALNKFLYRAKVSGDIRSIRQGIYTLGEYDVKELACKLRNKSYISLETVSKQEGVIFQYYKNIFLGSDDSRVIKIEDQEFKYYKIHDDILLNPLGIDHKRNYSIASKERAMCDRLYFSAGYYFDDLSGVNFKKLEEISMIYNKRVQKEVLLLRKRYEAE